jgi:hypothetical protein
VIAGLKPYAERKDSGVEWLGDVPVHWEIVPAFVAYRPREVRNVGMVEKTVLSLSYGRIVVKPEEKLRGLVPESFETYQIVDPGSIIVRTTDLQNDRNSLRIGHAKNRGIITSAYMCLETTSQVENEFGYQYLNAYDLLKIIYGYAVPRPCRPPHPAGHCGQAKADPAAGGAEAGHHPSRRHPWPGSRCAPQALRCRVAGGCAGALGISKSSPSHHTSR